MGKKRVYEAAKELGIPAKELIARLSEAGLDKKSNFSTLEEAEVQAITELFGKETTKATQADEVTEEKKVVEAVVAEAEPVVQKEEQPEKPAKKPKVDDRPSKVDDRRNKVDDRHNKIIRPPVVTILGHVDHGKTTLLDYIRSARVVDSEAGGITQSIGAYQAEYNGQKIAFIDTPGHAAFTNMRARGAQATDIVVLVVAADDGVMAQTEEAISHAKAAGVPIIVAINKIDKAPDRVDRVKQDLANHGLTPEDWGGDTIVVPLSALQGDGVGDLLEMILLTAELQELYADPDGPVNAVVIESHLDPRKGPITSVLVKDGTLRNRDVVLVGTSFGRIRALMDERGRAIDAAPPGMPAQVLGLDKVPSAGAQLEMVEKLSKAKEIAQARIAEERKHRLAPQRRSMSELMDQMLQKGKLRMILKADSVGCLEVMEAELRKIELEDVSIEILHTGVGPVSESDVMLAASGEDSKAAVIAFRTHVDKNAASRAQRHGVTLRTYNIIYDLTKDVESALKRMVEPEYQEVKLGVVEVRDVFKIPRVGTVAGCYVQDGVIMRSGKIRVLRDNVEIHEGSIRNLKRFDQDARQVEKGKECGILLEGFNDIQAGDFLENFKIERVEI